MLLCEFASDDVVGLCLEGVRGGAEESDLLVGPGHGRVDDAPADINGQEPTVARGFVDEEQDAANRQFSNAVAVQSRVGQQLADVVGDERGVGPGSLVVPDLYVTGGC